MVQEAALPRGVRVGLAVSISVVLLSLAGLLALFASARQPALPVFGQVPDFDFVDQEGRPFSDEDLAGRVHLVGFIYTSCPDICPAITAQMRALQTELARLGLTDQVHLVSITVDPEYDTPERLAAYARMFGADTSSWHFLTGRPNHVRTVVEKGFLVGMDRIATDYPIHAGHHQGHDHGTHAHGPDEAAGAGTTHRSDDALGADHGHGTASAVDYRVEHGGRVVLVDREGRIRAYHHGNLLDTDEVMAQIRLLLAGR
ncbi:SCO family protein [Symbiobacterium thermophilum]|uniref:Thioredoxin domain-containing protein n=1 Tax=Symbiobacterium thermophilum TaxID=2734 RepID=A0A953I1S6_SYMTR|nr:SCO family protein [Symbiobacterium thermophilum]MBY6275337.1 hypothetical protein [Symbiobacterium thermophilum]